MRANHVSSAGEGRRVVDKVSLIARYTSIENETKSLVGIIDASRVRGSRVDSLEKAKAHIATDRDETAKRGNTSDTTRAVHWGIYESRTSTEATAYSSGLGIEVASSMTMADAPSRLRDPLGSRDANERANAYSRAHIETSEARSSDERVHRARYLVDIESEIGIARNSANDKSRNSSAHTRRRIIGIKSLDRRAAISNNARNSRNTHTGSRIVAIVRYAPTDSNNDPSRSSVHSIEARRARIKAEAIARTYRRNSEYSDTARRRRTLTTMRKSRAMDRRAERIVLSDKSLSTIVYALRALREASVGTSMSENGKRSK